MSQKPSEQWEDAIFLLSDYAESLFRRAHAINGKPTKEEVEELKGLADNVNLWMETLEQQVTDRNE